jgi:hypothetical protein
MDRILDSLSTRELAIAIWIIIALIACFLSKNIRQSIFGIFRALFAWKVLVSLFAFFAHTTFYVFILYKISMWDITMLKDTIIWTLGFGFVALVNTNKINDSKYFKNVFFDALKWTIAIEFIVNFFTFSLTKELIFVPIIVLAAMMQAVASFDPKHKQVENLMKNFLLLFSAFVFLFSLYKTIQQHNDLFTFDNLKSFLLPVYLTITFLPFMYFYNLLVKYEELWVRLKFIIRDKKDRKRIKRRIIFIANLNIDKLASISKNIAKPINVYNDLSNKMIRQISKGEYIDDDSLID